MRQAEGKIENERSRCKNLEEELKTAEREFKNVLIQHQFTEETLAGLVRQIDDLSKLEDDIKVYDIKVVENDSIIKTLEEQTKDQEEINTDYLKESATEVEHKLKGIKEEQMRLYSMNRKNREVKEKLLGVYERKEGLLKQYEMLNHLSRTANGTLNGSVKLDFETYIQRQYFKRIIQAANRRLIKMTGGEFILQCREIKNLAGQGQAGLDLDVYHMVSDSVRDVKTLSGGESFMASLSMALGLADIVQNMTGGIQLDTMFVDEGFGSLDDMAREQAIKVLNELAGGNRLVGIISHVNELKEQIEEKLVVIKSEKGSRVAWKM